MKRQSKYSGLEKRKAVSGYIFILPFILGFLFFMLKPLAQSFWMSLCDVQLGPGTFEPVYWGLDNYVRAFTIDKEFNSMLWEQIGGMMVQTLAVMVFSMFVAVILNQKFRGRAFVRAIFFLPVILSSGVIVGIETNNALMASIQTAVKEAAVGPSITDALKDILVTAGVGTRVFETVFEVVDGIYDVAIASGIQIIIFLSGLQTISPSVYEAASIEGCTAWESFWKITFPMVSPLFLVNWVYTIIDTCMKSDNQIIDKVSDEIAININYGFASAMSWVYFLIVLAIVGVSSLIISKGVYYYD